MEDIPDTIHHKRFYVEQNDTTWWNETIIHIPTDTLLDISNSAFEAGNFNSNDKLEKYKVYFDRKEVIAYCDSVLSLIPLEDSRHGRLFVRRTGHELIREYAVKNKLGEIPMADALPILLKRFHPLVIKEDNGYKPPSIILRIEDNSVGIWRHYYVINNNDTLLFANGCDGLKYDD